MLEGREWGYSNGKVEVQSILSKHWMLVLKGRAWLPKRKSLVCELGRSLGRVRQKRCY